MAIAYGRPRLPGVPELLVRYEVAFAAPDSPRFILQHAIHPSSLHQVDLGSDTRQCLHVCKHSDPCHRQERDNYRMPLNVLRRLVVSVYKRRDKATAKDQLTVLYGECRAAVHTLCWPKRAAARRWSTSCSGRPCYWARLIGCMAHMGSCGGDMGAWRSVETLHTHIPAAIRKTKGTFISRNPLNRRDVLTSCVSLGIILILPSICLHLDDNAMPTNLC